MSAPSPSPWTRITVLVSTFPLTPALAASLHEVAWEMHQSGAPQMPIAGDFASGRVVNLHRRVLLGTLSGPAFEAALETVRGPGRVRYFLMDAEPPPPRTQFVN